MKQKPRSGTGRWWKMRNRGTAAFETSCLISIFQNLAKLFLKRMSSEAKCCDSIRKGFGFRQLFMPWSVSTNSTAKHVVDQIGNLLRQGKLNNIIGIPTLKQTQEHAISSTDKLQNLLKDWGCVAKMRNDGKGEAFVTDNGDYIVELHIEKEMEGLQVASDAILRIVGVVEQKNSSIPFRLS
ncbi:hypothetical protein V6N12_045984 [Hibiscus sabdariffa]|uniref:Uncharacterized protein n=1 Tax=Hibiscus sabdariffa TaxID=183260 RepID=A0ABR2G491_9ROSI